MSIQKMMTPASRGFPATPEFTADQEWIDGALKYLSEIYTDWDFQHQQNYHYPWHATHKRFGDRIPFSALDAMVREMPRHDRKYVDLVALIEPTVKGAPDGVVKGRYYPDMPPRLPDEDDFAYTDRLTGADQADRRPYDHRRFRQCSIGYHEECSDKTGTEGCECPCHQET